MCSICILLKKIERIDSVSNHDEYRGKPLPAFKVWLSGKGNPIAYVSMKDGGFQISGIFSGGGSVFCG